MKKSKGITLIALVITIIVLLILGGVAINAIIGEGSIIKNAEKAVGEYDNKVEEEGKILNETNKYMENKSEQVD